MRAFVTGATGFVGALDEPRSVGQTFDLCGHEALPLDQILDLIFEAIGRGRFKLHLPLWLARIQAGLLELAFPRMLGRAPPLNGDQLTSQSRTP